MKTLISSILVIILLGSTSFAQEKNYNKMNLLSSRWLVSVEGGATYTRSDFVNSRFNYYTRLMGEYFIPTTNFGILGLRAFTGGGFLKGDNKPQTGSFKTDIVLLGGGLIYALQASDIVFPYGYVGASYFYFDPKDNSGNRLPHNKAKQYSRNEYLLQGELGVRFLLAQNFSLNLNGAVNYVRNDNLDDKNAGTDNDIFFTFLGGFSFYFGGVRDSDSDGITDDEDVCPDTPHGVQVDEYGCPLDTDKDGVPDYLDRCPNTQANIVVDESGCPIDTDEDGVPDYLDQCPNTPLNVPVNMRGCPLDEDGDGVPDYTDNCPGTPPGTEVDKFGCPLKSQQKGLPDITKFVLSGEINFQIGKSELLPGARTALNKLLVILQEYPDTKWRIEGHTDNTGSYKINKKISKERAWAVANYLIKHGADLSRLEVVGLGPDYPIGDNSTETGRALNRRVTIELITGKKVVNETVPKRLKGDEYNAAVERNVGNMIFTDGRLFCFQVSSWRKYEKALSEVERLQADGENAFVVEAKNLPQLHGTWYRVRIGYFNSLEEARRHRAKVMGE
ncbi:alpha-agarase precursor [bacterium BMS3Abin03]|nr:alpha-agarase precursor [bacterium BMS3Abin03]